MQKYKMQVSLVKFPVVLKINSEVIPFSECIWLIRICNLQNINLEIIIPEPLEYDRNCTQFTELFWTISVITKWFREVSWYKFCKKNWQRVIYSIMVSDLILNIFIPNVSYTPSYDFTRLCVSLKVNLL